MHPDIDAYYALEPFSYSELLELDITPADEPATQGLTVRLALASRVDTGRQLALIFTGVTGLTVEDFSGPSVSPFEIVGAAIGAGNRPDISSGWTKVGSGSVAWSSTQSLSIRPPGDIRAHFLR